MPPFVGGIFLVLTFYFAAKTAWSLYEDWKWKRFFEAVEQPTGLYGGTEAVGLNELVRAGLKTDNLDGNGIPVGAIANQMLYYHGTGHLSYRAGTGGGKTASSVAPICFALGKHRNIVLLGKGKEPACLVAAYRRSIGQEVRIVDLGNQMGGTGFQTDHFNPVGHLVELADCNDPALIDEARKIAATLASDQKDSSSENSDFFKKQAKKWKTWLLVATAIMEATTGELCCNLPYIYTLACSGDKNFQSFLSKMQRLDEYEGTVKGAAKRILDKMKTSPKLFESVLSELENMLEIYDPASHLGKISVLSDFDPRDIKRKPMTIIVVTDPTKSGTHGIAAGLTLEVLTSIALQAQSFEPRLTILADEFANLSKGTLPSMIPALFTGRSLGVQLITYVQDSSSFSRYGDEASAFTTQPEIIMAWKCRSTKDAEIYSKLSGQISVMSENTNLPQGVESDANKSYSVGMSEKGIPRYRADDFLHMADFKAALFFKQLPAVMIDLVSYTQVLPWRDQAGTVPGAQEQTEELPIKFDFTSKK